MTFAIFHVFPGLENGLSNSMTFHDQGGSLYMKLLTDRNKCQVTHTLHGRGNKATNMQLIQHNRLMLHKSTFCVM